MAPTLKHGGHRFSLSLAALPAGASGGLSPVVLTQSLSPTIVAANTTAEQTFTIAGLAAGDAILSVSKPTAQAGLFIGGWRIASATTIGVTFGNDTASGITPTAAETYTVAVARNLASSGGDNSATEMIGYDYNYTAYGVYDYTQEAIVRATLVTAANVTGAATNNFAAVLSHYNVGGSLVDQVIYTFGNGTNATAFIPIDVTNVAPGTGTGIQQGWKMLPGDTVVFSRTSNGTGLASPAMTVTFDLGVYAS